MFTVSKKNILKIICFICLLLSLLFIAGCSSGAEENADVSDNKIDYENTILKLGETAKFDNGIEITISSYTPNAYSEKWESGAIYCQCGVMIVNNSGEDYHYGSEFKAVGTDGSILDLKHQGDAPNLLKTGSIASGFSKTANIYFKGEITQIRYSQSHNKAT